MGPGRPLAPRPAHEPAHGPAHGPAEAGHYPQRKIVEFVVPELAKERPFNKNVRIYNPRD